MVCGDEVRMVFESGASKATNFELVLLEGDPDAVKIGPT